MVTELIRVLVVDDHQVVRAGLRAFLDVSTDVRVVGEAADGAEAIDQVAALEPDVVLMDLKMPVMDGASATAEIRNRFPAVQVVALTSLDDDALVTRVLDAGAIGFLFKDADADELLTAIRLAKGGRGMIAPDAIQAVLHRPAPDAEAPHLTNRELEILRMLARGRTNPVIAKRLGISVSTVNYHVHNILDKLDARTRTEAVVTAARDGLIEL